MIGLIIYKKRAYKRPRKSKQLRQHYIGQLNKPITLPPEPQIPQLLFDSDSINNLKKAYAEDFREYRLEVSGVLVSQYTQKLLLLLGRFSLKPSEINSWAELVANLAIDHIPGFNLKTFKQPSVIWTPVTYAKLYFDICTAMAATSENARTIKLACKQVIKTEPWNGISEIEKSGSTFDITAKTLQNRYSHAKTSPLIKGYLRMKKQNVLGEALDKIYIDHVNQMFIEEQKLSQ